MKFLFIHQNFPGQFLHIAAALVAKNHKVSALTLNQRKLSKVWQGIEIIEYSLDRVNGKDTFPLATDFESKMIRAASCYSKAMELKSEGYSPDIIISHPGWGESLFLKQVWPEALLKIYCEFFYSISGQDIGFDSECDPRQKYQLPKVYLKNTNMLLHADQAHSFISPTSWQASTFPDYIRDKITVIHDGIDTNVVSPNSNAAIDFGNGKKISRKDEVITFISRSLEPYRGFHIFMRSLPEILRRRKNAIVFIVGNEGVSYGAEPPDGHSWKSLILKEIRPLLNNQEYGRIRFLGNIPYESFKTLLCISTVHVYLTYPFVLSWSLLEAMSSSCTIVASKTPPVEEVITNGETGILVDFFEYEEITEEVLSLFENPEKRAMLGVNARSFIRERYDLKTKCLPAQIAWAERI